ncbi:MAG TPA: DUF3883 domain-containing protein [Arcobacter sp.]|nr:DUF3883 domain-containing protein [Arcobacter sp.]
MFYNLHRNAVIGYKKLSPSDLGTSSTSNQTHIGLYEDTLNFITNYYQEASAQLIYGTNIYEAISLLDPIENPDGSLRSPKIRIGEDGDNAVARIVRDITNEDPNGNWYLLWFGLENEELVFLLIKENSDDYNMLIQQRENLDSGRVYTSDRDFAQIIHFLNTKINRLNFSYFEELELLSQVAEGTLTTRRKPRRYDIEKAQKLFQEIGRKGEEIVNEHLNRLLYSREIQSFQWMNQHSESGLPFDFEIQRNDGNILYSDSKATSYRFEQKMIFSSQELQFINENKNYMVHRVFNLNENPQLRVCENIANITDNFLHNYEKFNIITQEEDIYVKSMKISVPPTNRLLNFYDEAI